MPTTMAWPSQSMLLIGSFPMPVTRIPCPDCLAFVPDIDGPTHAYLGGNAGCWEKWGELQSSAMTHRELGSVMPLAVDAYMAQHPGTEGRRQAQSVAVHLASICLVLEHGRTPSEGIRAKQVLLARARVFAWLQPPSDPGRLTLLDVIAASDADVAAVVRSWARSVWTAWAAHHATIRPLAEEALRGMYR
jgi:Family of unknown function (DUF5946)